MQPQQKQEHEQTSSNYWSWVNFHTVIAKWDYIHADQTLTDSFYKGFYSDGSLLSWIEEKTHGGRTGRQASQVKPPEPTHSKI